MLLIRKGELVAQGTHEELLRAVVASTGASSRTMTRWMRSGAVHWHAGVRGTRERSNDGLHHGRGSTPSPTTGTYCRWRAPAPDRPIFPPRAASDADRCRDDRAQFGGEHAPANHRRWGIDKIINDGAQQRDLAALLRPARLGVLAWVFNFIRQWLYGEGGRRCRAPVARAMPFRR